MARAEQRRHFLADTRLELLEADQDRFEESLGDLEQRINARFDRQDARLGKIMAACVGILTALVGALVLLALNLATGA